jgi:hypothetical protein
MSRSTHRPLSRHALTLACALLSSVAASAQGFNVDFDDATQGALNPAASYAAAGTPGTWNAVGVGAVATPLLDKTGAASSVTITLDSNLSADLYSDNANTLGDDGSLMDDIIFGGSSGNSYPITFDNLANGTYDVYTYAMAPDNKLGYITDIDVIGSTDGLQAVGGSTFTGHAQGVSYALHTVDVTNGTLTVTVAVNTTFISVNGIQIEPSAGNFPGYCFGDGSATACPCGNPGAPGEGCANGTGQGAILSGSGTTSVAADDLAFAGAQFTPGQPALLFAGLNAVNSGNGNLFGDGLRCAGGTVKRLGVTNADGSGDLSWGSGHAAQGGWVAGDVRRFQGWYRDPIAGPCGSGFNLSNGLEVQFVP